MINMTSLREHDKYDVTERAWWIWRHWDMHWIQCNLSWVAILRQTCTSRDASWSGSIYFNSALIYHFHYLPLVLLSITKWAMILSAWIMHKEITMLIYSISKLFIEWKVSCLLSSWGRRGGELEVWSVEGVN